MRIKLTVEYDGMQFYGWQKQNDRISVQETVEHAISRLFNGAESVELYGAGRTDTGVHATGQVAHFDIPNGELAEKWRANIWKLHIGINSYLIDSGAVITSAEIAPDGFHARASAIMRHYEYIILNRNIKSVIHANRMWHIVRRLDDVAMNEAAKLFIGTHNLNAFRSAHCSAANPVRTISSVEVRRDGDRVIIQVAARSFLHNQVRIMVGTLVQIGLGIKRVDHIQQLLESMDRTAAGPTAPPYGLYLTKVEY
ncbi:MAG: tRNA pseudouridine(38-40) synthase TruA [Holosporales bacterium]|jgi:tRNA pseudouridine38-40 synthase|nr:tRNA pseudouridine(38-40) synthase TruA [Holosporales bacterium]